MLRRVSTGVCNDSGMMTMKMVSIGAYNGNGAKRLGVGVGGSLRLAPTTAAVKVVVVKGRDSSTGAGQRLQVGG